MSTLKADAITSASSNTDIVITGAGSGVPDIEASFKVGGVAGVPTASIQASAVTTAKINDDAVTTAKIVNDAVTLAKLAAGTDGELITWDASGDPATVAVGTAAHILTSNGAGAAPTFQAAAGGGAWNVIESKVPTAAATVDFNTNIDGTYFLYMFSLVGLVASGGGQQLVMRTSTDGGSSWDSGGSDYVTGIHGMNSSGTAKALTYGTTYIPLTSGDTASGHRFSGQLFMYQPSNSAMDTLFLINSINAPSSGVLDFISASGGKRDAYADLDGVQFLWQGGANFDTEGRITLYGVAYS